jgi:hypothetical protein
LEELSAARAIEQKPLRANSLALSFTIILDTIALESSVR